ncbi:MAG: hypothetical protein NVV82_02055 [Sporocytophaga sp.]|nr:hypothetical protein [Sporocytophaga sp.]
MNYIFKGNLLAYYCGDCFDPIYKAKVRIYRPDQSSNLTLNAVAASKETFHQRSEEELKSLSSRLIAEVETDALGNFVFELNERQQYKGEAFEIDFECGNVPLNIKLKNTPKSSGPFQFHITTLQPLWKISGIENTALAYWEYSIASSYWCRILTLLDLYVICGKVTECETKLPIQGLQVFAYDVDLIQDDFLGMGLTDASGHYKIYYTKADFSKTIFNWLNVEWPAGPDVYFRVETSTGTVLLQESRSKGHTQARNNIGHCFCTDLCVEGKGDSGNNYVPALFTKVGAYSIATDFDANGYTNDAQRNVFTGTIPLIGILPGGNSSNAMEYRFTIRDLANPAVTIIADSSLISPTIIGSIVKLTLVSTPFPHYVSVTEDYYVNNVAASNNVIIKPGGWIEVPRENDLFGVGQFQSGGGSILANLDTTKLTAVYNENYDLINPTVYQAGQLFPATKKAGIHTFEITFEAREVGSLTLSTSNVLAKIVLSNVNYLQRRHPSWAGADVNLPATVMLEIQETTAGGAGCNKIDDTLTALYSVVHPHLDNMRLSFEGNAPLPSDFPQNLSGSSEAVNNFIFNTSTLNPCAYVVWLSVNLRLTSGYGRIPGSHITDHIAFCKS